MSITANASDDIGVDRVEFLLDGALLGSDASAPCSFAWNSATASNGAHALAARAIDLAGNTGVSPQVNVTVSGLVIDANSGCFGACAIDIADWDAPPMAAAVAQPLPFSGGTQTSTPFAASGLAAINRSGRTQLKLRFADHQTATQSLWIGNGSTATLKVTYQP